MTDSVEARLAAAKQLLYSGLKTHTGKDFFSQATQDLFVLEMLQNKESGTFLEIGAGHPWDSNNTALLESQHGWRGLSIDNDSSLVDQWHGNRESVAIAADATNCDYLSLLQQFNLPKQVDYLTVDIEPADKSLAALRALPHDVFRFSVITFEHDRYRVGNHVATESRVLLESLGYELVVSDLKIFGSEFEDWWVDPRTVSETVWKPFRNSKIDFSKLWFKS